jgi:protein-tyrosine-phosphatase/DNA-binding transcriptional ArsR family regulator
MKPERIVALERRSAVHAALADPARLAIVDALTLGDASPSELQSMLEMASNLVAHHLKSLESTGIVARHRSEGDRRRTYLSLVPGALVDAGVGAVASASRVVFVCTANSARSQLAAALWRRASRIPVTSAGTHPVERIDPGAIAVARRRRLRLVARRPRALDDVLASQDLVVTVCDHAHEELAVGGRGSHAALHWSVRDPVPAGTDDAFEDTFTDLTRRVGDLAARVQPF